MFNDYIMDEAQKVVQMLDQQKRPSTNALRRVANGLLMALSAAVVANEFCLRMIDAPAQRMYLANLHGQPRYQRGISHSALAASVILLYYALVHLNRFISSGVCQRRKQPTGYAPITKARANAIISDALQNHVELTNNVNTSYVRSFVGEIFNRVRAANNSVSSPRRVANSPGFRVRSPRRAPTTGVRVRSTRTANLRGTTASYLLPSKYSPK